MADAGNYFEDSDFLKLLIRVRLSMDEEFASSRKKKSLLWDNVHEKIKEKHPNLNLSRDHIIRKYLNLMTTYRRIITRKKEPGRRTSTWEFFDEFNKVYGNKYSIDHPISVQLAADKSTAALNEIEYETWDDTTSINEIKCDPFDESTALNEIKCEPDDDSIALNEVKCEPCDLTESNRSPEQPASYDTRSEDEITVPALNDIKCERSNDSLEFERNISLEPPTKKRCDNEILEYLRRESIRKQKRHENILAIEKKKLQMQEKKINAMVELKDVLKKTVANKLS